MKTEFAQGIKLSAQTYLAQLEEVLQQVLKAMRNKTNKSRKLMGEMFSFRCHGGVLNLNERNSVQAQSIDKDVNLNYSIILNLKYATTGQGSHFC